ncbi:HD domain-containing protein [Chitinolyticbacter meiyuanensis]|uniref:HD domain-containing protein n=1 Tax=Chitinolyticbacter meiyuanensis TaxID=682798 RepID=UPI0011E5CBFE|nr:HD domain-containing protein [Chitinolyticbacter meiyuanensis]
MAGATPFQAVRRFILETDGLKGVTRKSRPVGMDRLENVAEHSWQVTLLALTLREQAAFQIDIDRVLRMLLVHDIPEVEVGDVNVYDTAAIAAREEGEARAAERLFGLLPGEQGATLLALWHEMEDGATPEARYAKAIDRLMPILLNLAQHGRSWRENGVKLSQVLRLNRIRIAPVFPELWAELEAELNEAGRQGWLSEE